MAVVSPAPRPSALEKLLDAEASLNIEYPDYLHHLTTQILHNLQYQHRWTDLQIHVKSPLTGNSLPRPLISGLPPKRLYIHPDEQVELLKAEALQRQGNEDAKPSRIEIPVEEWVLPSHLKEKWTLRGFAEVFDCLESKSEKGEVKSWHENKRVVLATVQDDSTIVYYIMHDGIVKPRQN